MLNFGTLPIYLRGNSPVFIEQEAEMPQNSSESFGEDRKMSGINPRLSHPACSLVTSPTEVGKYSGKAQSDVI